MKLMDDGKGLYDLSYRSRHYSELNELLKRTGELLMMTNKVPNFL